MPAYGVSQSDVQHIRVNARADGDNTVIAAPAAGKKIIVVGYCVSFSAAGTATFKSGAAGTTHADFDSTAGSGSQQYAGNWDAPAFECDAATAFVISNTAAMDTVGHISFYVVGVE